MNQIITLKFLPFLFIVLCLNACDSVFGDDSEGDRMPDAIDVGEATKSYPDVDENLWVYFERFEQAAFNRGIEVDLSHAHVTGSIEDVPGQTSPGLCTYGTGMNHVNITEDFWERADITKREIMVFHELGHCFLGRGHMDLAHPNGICISLMRTGGDHCVDHYNMDTRDVYLDELFGL